MLGGNREKVEVYDEVEKMWSRFKPLFKVKMATHAKAKRAESKEAENEVFVRRMKTSEQSPTRFHYFLS